MKHDPRGPLHPGGMTSLLFYTDDTFLNTGATFMEDDTLGDCGISTEGSRNVGLRVVDSNSKQDAGTPAGPIARSGQDAETESKDPTS